MIKTAQNLATRYEIPREEIDAFAVRSHRKAAAARDSGRLAKEIFPVDAPGVRKGETRSFEHDESIRDDTTLERLAALPPQPGTETMTAGNSSRSPDGASGVVLASAAHGQQLGATPLARILSSAAVGVDPMIMGIARAYALPRAIEKAGLTADQIDVYEIHEASAAQVLGVRREFSTHTGSEIGDDRLNPNGGAVALGHPFGDCGTRCVLTLPTGLRERGLRYGAIGISVGSGQGVAPVIENTHPTS